MTDYYSDFAQFYDEGTETDIVSKVDLLKGAIDEHAPNAHTLLELACGTGNVLALLARKYDVTGLDLSPAMLRIAHEKLPAIELNKADMTTFRLGRKFDVIICVFDSVNHLLSFEQWEALFNRVKEHLSAGGVFIVDVNTISKLERFSKSSPFKRELEKGYQVVNITKHDDDVYHWNIDIYVPQENGPDKVVHNDIPEIAFPLQQIEDSLQSRFKSVKQLTADATAPNESADRIYFVCTS